MYPVIPAMTGCITRSYIIMDRQEAIEFLMDHYENPRNNEPLENADINLKGGNPGCADIITMYARFGEDGRLEAVNWEGEGCTISRAAASYVTEITQGMTAEEVENMSFEDLVEQLGRELVMTRPTCATLALGTLKKGVHEYHMHKTAQEPLKSPSAPTTEEHIENK